MAEYFPWTAGWCSIEPVFEQPQVLDTANI